MRHIERQDADQQQFASDLAIPEAYSFEAAIRSTYPYQSEAATRPAGKKGNLKKRIQFTPGLNGATSYVKGDYGNMPAGGIEENKAKLSQLHESVLAKVAGIRKKSPAAANSLTG